MNDIQFITVNEDSTIKVEYKTTKYVDIPNPSNLTGQELVTYVTQKINELSAGDDYLNPDEGIMVTLGIEEPIREMVIMEIIQNEVPTT